MNQPLLEPVNADGVRIGSGRWMVVIYNNDTNSMQEVMLILMCATSCDAEEAYMETWEAHTYGKAPVHFADASECRYVASVIETIGVKTSVCPEWED